MRKIIFALVAATGFLGCEESATGPSDSSAEKPSALHSTPLSKLDIIGDMNFGNERDRLAYLQIEGFSLDTTDHVRIHGPGFDTTYCNGYAKIPVLQPGDTVWAEMFFRDSGLVFQAYHVVEQGAQVSATYLPIDSILRFAWKDSVPNASFHDTIAILDWTGRTLRRWSESWMDVPTREMLLDLSEELRIAADSGRPASLRTGAMVELPRSFTPRISRVGSFYFHWDQRGSQAQVIPLP